MSDFASWSRDLEALVEAGAAGEPLNLEAVTKLAKQARAMGPQLDPEQRAQVGRCITKLSELIRDGMEHIEGELSTIGERRAGVRVYGQLRSNHTGQRLRRRV